MKEKHTSSLIKSPIIILHGWGLKGSAYNQLVLLLKESGHPTFAPDLPGFGKEPLTKPAMTLDDYVQFVDAFIKEKKLNTAVFIGHSNGGRIALKYAWKYPEKVTRLILTGVPIIRHLTLRKKTLFVLSMVGGIVFRKSPILLHTFLRKVLYRVAGEYDYYNAKDLKETFKNIIKEDLIGYAQKIVVPTILVWGNNDTFVPVSDVKKIQQLMPHAKTIIAYHQGHKLPYSDPSFFSKAVLSFL